LDPLTSITCILDELYARRWWPFGEALNCMPSPPGHDEELIEVDTSFIIVSDGRR
jgi:hypothetical protein